MRSRFRSLWAVALSALPVKTRRRLLLSRLRIDHDRLREVEIHVARTHADVCAALALLHDVYVGVQLIQPHSSGLHLTPHNAQPTTLIFLARLRGRVIGTTSLVFDGPLGLPAEATHADVIGSLRSEGERIGESTGSACAPDFRSSGLALCLYRAMVHAARAARLDSVVMRVDPRSSLVLEELLVCDPLGPARLDPGFGTSFSVVRLRVALGEGRVYERFVGLAPYDRTPHAYFFGPVPCRQIEVPARFEVCAERQAASDAVKRTRPDLFGRSDPGPT